MSDLNEKNNKPTSELSEEEIKEKVRITSIREKFMGLSDPTSDEFKVMAEKQKLELEELAELKEIMDEAPIRPAMHPGLIELTDARLYNSAIAANTERMIKKNARNVKMPESDDELVNEIIKYDLKGFINIDGKEIKVAKGSTGRLTTYFIMWLAILVLSFGFLSFLFIKIAAGEVDYPLLAIIPSITALLSAVFSILSIYRIVKRKDIVRRACLNNTEDSLQMLYDLKVKYLMEDAVKTTQEKLNGAIGSSID